MISNRRGHRIVWAVVLASETNYSNDNHVCMNSTNMYIYMIIYVHITY